jgi:hypothetical protein
MGDYDEFEIDPEDDGLVYDTRIHAYVYDEPREVERCNHQRMITWGETQVGPVNIPRAPWERPEDYADDDATTVSGWEVELVRPEWTEGRVYRADVRFSNGVAAVISFPSVEARDAFLSGGDIENYRIEGDDL